MLVTIAPLPQDGCVHGRNNGCTALSPALVHGNPVLSGGSHVFAIVEPTLGVAKQDHGIWSPISTGNQKMALTPEVSVPLFEFWMCDLPCWCVLCKAVSFLDPQFPQLR